MLQAAYLGGHVKEYKEPAKKLWGKMELLTAVSLAWVYFASICF